MSQEKSAGMIPTMTMSKHRDMADSIARWAAGTPRIRRVWLFANGARREAPGNGQIEVAVELEPVGDSEETLAIWMANAGSWQSQLRNRVSTALELEWFDPDGGAAEIQTRLNEEKALVYERAPLD
jgi:hypothetical protein